MVYKKNKADLTEKQRRFADEYIASGNVMDSAIKAGYSKAYAKSQSYKLLENVGIKAYVDERLEKIKSEKIADQTEILEFLTAVIRGEVAEPVLVLDGEGTQRIEHLRPPVNVRKSAAVDLGKRYAMWTEKSIVENITPVFVEDVEEDEE
jgi:phage terminase small subunit